MNPRIVRFHDVHMVDGQQLLVLEIVAGVQCRTHDDGQPRESAPEMEPDMVAADDTLRLWDVNSRGWTNLGLAKDGLRTVARSVIDWGPPSRLRG